MDVTLAQDRVLSFAHLGLVPILGVEQHLVAGLDVAHVRPDRHHLGPRESLGHLRRRRDENAGARLALALGLGHLHEHAIAQHLDRLLLVARGHLDQDGTGRTAIPRAARCCLASPTECWPKWKIDAASTASAPPSSAPWARCSRVPTPPLAMTGMLTASVTARVSSRSKPSRVPSRSIDVSKISPAPSRSHSTAHDTASSPVGLRPPCVHTSQPML